MMMMMMMMMMILLSSTISYSIHFMKNLLPFTELLKLLNG